MTEVTLTEQALRAAMRDPRYWRPNPEREAYGDWVTEGWKSLVAAQAAAGSDGVEVRVKGYVRTRNGKREHVDDYPQMRARGAGDATPVQSSLRSDPLPVPADGREARQRPVVIFVGGFFDQTASRIVEGGVRRFADFNPNVETHYFPHDAGRDIVSLITALPQDTKVRLVGHSWGASEAAWVAGRLGGMGRPVETLVTIDPVGNEVGHQREFASLDRARAGAIRWINVNAAPGGGYDFSDAVADFGGKYGQTPRDLADTHIDAAASHNAFWSMLEAGIGGGASIRDAITRP